MKIVARLTRERYRNRFLILFPAVVFLIYIYLYSNLDLFQEYQRVSYIQNEIKIVNKSPSGPNSKWFFPRNSINQTISHNSRVLIICKKSTSSQNTHFLISLLEPLRVKYKLKTVDAINSKDIIKLFDKERSYFTLIIFESINSYRQIRKKNLNHIFDYCRQYQVGVITLLSDAFIQSPIYTVDGANLAVKTLSSKSLNSCYYGSLYNKELTFFKLTRYVDDEVFISSVDSDYKVPVVSTRLDDQNTESILKCNNDASLVVKSNDNNVNKVFITSNWVQLPTLRTLFIDAMTYASYGRISMDTGRLIQIDIDDIFVGATGSRMKAKDVDALIEFQNNHLNPLYFNSTEFKFNLGYSGYYFEHGNDEEDLGDKQLINKRAEFNWFDHTWSHSKAHLLNASSIKKQLLLNYNFALQHSLPIGSQYAVAPHHSGIYPVYDKLYEQWSDILSVKATSTEEYPHMKPGYMRKGFIHKGILVAPRQTCGIFTHTQFKSKYPGGIDKLVKMINGGELFHTVLVNRVLIFMTHMSNYGNDRLGLFVFKNLFEFVTKWTNINFISKAPLKLVQKYFEFYPDDSEPIWTNPCDDKKHLNIWNLNRTICDTFPKVIIIGPQKTGSTALYTYLNIHPKFKSNKVLPKTFEETQFFTNSHYSNGIQWYLNLFDDKPGVINFEKSANYFSEPEAPVRITKLLKDKVQIVFISINPVKRAYSWYQHMKAHNHSIALKYKFYDILKLKETNKTILESMRSLRQRCIESGFYFKHLLNWLNHLPLRNIHLVDGELLKVNPPESMNLLQKQLKMRSEDQIDYKNLLKFNPKKGFFCKVVGSKNNLTKCLGAGKGRKYEAIDRESESYLNELYKEPNANFLRLLKKRSLKIPIWLNETQTF